MDRDISVEPPVEAAPEGALDIVDAYGQELAGSVGGEGIVNRALK